ncbi:MAG TPA: RNA 3'-terminal phosphate cyclase [Thermoproteota archaeon]|nr:RNA 3'-terminal phosphate cyclase [Thermoproteota archaeon]
MEIDGSYGEGGGQLLRFSMGLSTLFGEDVTIVNIRANRNPSGIRPQHLAAIRAVGMLANAELSGDAVGSSSISFKPGKVTGGEFEFNVGTAGSVTLVLQAILPVALMAESPVSGRIVGGTEVKWSPTVDYFDQVFLKGLRSMGVDISVELVRSGYYPKGGGIIRFSVRPRARLAPLVANASPKNDLKCYGVSRCAHLPISVAERQTKSVRALLNSAGIPIARLDTVRLDDSISPGSSVTLWAISKSASFIGSDSVGERGKAAEIVGSEAATAFSNCTKAGSAVDDHFADMILPYMLKAEGQSKITIPSVSEHLLTEVHVAKLFGAADIQVNDHGLPPEIVVVPKT